MMVDHETRPVGAAVPAANAQSLQATRLPLQQHSRAFTLAELVVSIGVLVILALLAIQLLNSAAIVTTLGHKQMDADSQTRQLLDRMAVDFAQMVKRSDVDYYVKSSAIPPPTGVRNLLWTGNDKIAFYSAVPGFYPPTGSQSPVSLVAYRVNAQNKLERMGKGLVWNAVSTADTPVVFMPIPLASPLPIAELPNPTPNPLPTPAWPTVADFTASPTPEPNVEVIGPQVFRFEYYYLLKGQTDPTSGFTYTAILSDTPWDTRICSCPTPAPTPTPTPGASATPTPIPTPTPPSLCCHTAPEGMQDVAAVVVAIAVIDPKSKVLVTDAQLARLNGADGQPPVLVDYAAGMTPGQLLAQWRAALDLNTVGLSRPAISGIRVYERYLYLSPPTLLTP
jgi:type II secretory pathway pseudopilin PulG